MTRNDVEQRRYHDTERPAVDIEKRLMFSFALFGAFSFGFIFFGEAPTILGLLVFLGPANETMLLAKILGMVGLASLGVGIWLREGWGWRPATVFGAASLFSSWLLFYGIVGGNLMTFLGTAPFLFFALWFLVDSLRSLGARIRFRSREESYTGELEKSRIEPVMQNARFAGFFSNLLSSLRDVLKAEEEKRRRRRNGEYPTTH